MMPYLLLLLSITLSVGRNTLSKSISTLRIGTRSFFLCQGTLFLSGAVVISLIGGLSFTSLSPLTLVLSLIYGIFLILAQWFYTVALSKGNTALCSTVYSLGFIFPTLSGAVIWSEPFSTLDLLGIASAILAVIVSGAKKRDRGNVTKANYFLPLVVAMISSGGLGIIQKLQQSSEHHGEKALFLVLSFLLASATSLVFALSSQDEGGNRVPPKKLIYAASVGLFFGCCNLLNTSLAGMLDSAIFFPTLNIGVILLTMISGVIFFKERIKKRELAVLILGTSSILLLNLG